MKQICSSPNGRTETTLKTRLVRFVLVCAVAVDYYVYGQTSPAITEDDIRAHIQYLASDELEGRASGSPGNRKAAEYIADHFERYGLSPAGDNGSYFQHFEFVSSLRPGQANNVVIANGSDEMTLKLSEDFLPLGFSSDGAIKASACFVGYGITAADQKYDDYAGIDVTGKIVLMLRYSPDGNNPHGGFEQFASLRQKARIAREKGAVGMILVTGPSDLEDDRLVDLVHDQAFGSSGIPGISMKREFCDKLLLKSHGTTIRILQDSINANKQPASRDLPGCTIQIQTQVVRIKEATANILGMLKASTPKSDEIVVIGAHMDHLGYGGQGSGALDPDVKGIHNGADDNASGTAALMEIAEQLSKSRESLQRSVLFIAFSGEELGTLGSGHYVNTPFVPLSKTIAMLNMDMVGRMTNRTLTVHGMGTSPQWESLVRAQNAGLARDSFDLKFVQDGFGPSDHAQFYGKDVPVLFFFTGVHSDYHKVTDDVEFINYKGEKEIAQFVSNILSGVANADPRPQFTKAGSTPSMGDRRGFNVTLGIVPDYGDTGTGLKVGSVRADGPAEKAGVKAGDVIVELAGKSVLNIYDYMGILGELKAGQEVGVKVQRSGSVLDLKALLTKR